MKFGKLFLEVFGYLSAMFVIFLMARIAAPYFLSQPSTLENCIGFLLLIASFACSIALVVSLIYPLIKQKDPTS